MRTTKLMAGALTLLVLVGAFVAVRFFSVSIIAVILVCGAIGALDTWRQEKHRRAAQEK